MAGKVVLRYKDYAGQTSNFEFFTDDITDANLDTISTQVDAVVTAIESLSLGNLNVQQLVAEYDEVSSAKASSPASRRELKWLLTFVDTVDGHSETRELPCVDVTDSTLFSASDGEDANLANAQWTSFESAIEAVIKSSTGNSMSFTGARLVGRNI